MINEMSEGSLLNMIQNDFPELLEQQSKKKKKNKKASKSRSDILERSFTSKKLKKNKREAVRVGVEVGDDEIEEVYGTKDKILLN